MKHFASSSIWHGFGRLPPTIRALAIRNYALLKRDPCHSLLYFKYFAALGFDLRVEDATNHGRIDMALLLPARVYLFEFKVLELLPEGALQ